MKATTITIINDSQSKALTAFELSAKALDISYNIVSPSTESIVDISVKYENEAELFILGSSYQLYKSKK